MKPRMNYLMTLLFAACLVQSNAQMKCYRQAQCLSMIGSGSSKIPAGIPGLQQCPTAGFGKTVDCLKSNGCQKTTMPMAGGGEMVMRDCGPTNGPADGSTNTGSNPLISGLNSVSDAVKNTVPSVRSYLCHSDMCNSGGRARAPILCSLILAFASIVYARLA